MIRMIVFTVIFGIFIGAMAISPVAPAPALGAPLAQATATPTNTPTNTPTITPTPTNTPTRVAGERAFRPAGDPPTDMCIHAVGDGSFANCVDPYDFGYTSPVVSIATVSATANATPVLAANPARVYAYCENDNATNPVYLRPGSTGAVGTGIRLNSSGGSYEMSPRNGSLYTGPVYAIATQTTASLTCVEGSR